MTLVPVAPNIRVPGAGGRPEHGDAGQSAAQAPRQRPASPVRPDGEAERRSPPADPHGFLSGGRRRPWRRGRASGWPPRAGADTGLCKLNPNGERTDCVSEQRHPLRPKLPRVQPRGGRPSLSVCPRPPPRRTVRPALRPQAPGPARAGSEGTDDAFGPRAPAHV